MILAGLRRLAALIGMTEAEGSEHSDLTLRSAGDVAAASEIDVSCSDAGVVVTVGTRPPREVWLLILELVEQIIPAESGTPAQGSGVS